MEAEARGRPAADRCHREDEVRRGAEAGGEDAEPSSGEAQLCDVDGVVRYFVCLQEVLQECLYYVICRSRKRSIPGFPRWVWVVGWEVIHDVGGEEVGDLLNEAR